MATPHLPSNCCYLHNVIDSNKKHQQLHCCCYSKLCNHSARVLSSRGLFTSSKTLLILSLRPRNRHCWRFIANAELRIVVDRNSQSSRSSAQSPIVPSVEIPVTCYQILRVPEQAEKDEIVKSVMHLRNAQIEEGYTADVAVSRQAGEDNIVLDIGRKALQHPDAKLYVHDILLSMALAECEIAKIGFEKNKISRGFDALARAQCLLRIKISLGKMTLLSQIEESLEELAPACTLELLGMPHTPENAEQRLGAISALRELLRRGLDVESSRQVQDWPCFLNQALNKLMATEIVELLSWDDLALTRKNKKSRVTKSKSSN